MSEFPLGYERIAPATWVYLSSLLMIGLFFKFNRALSVRNLDLVLLILLAPGLLLVIVGRNSTDGALAVSSELEVAVMADERQPSKPSSDEKAGDEKEEVAVDSAGRSLLSQRVELTGYIWLFVVASLFLARMLLDPTMVRRPLLEPNLSSGGLIFIGCSLFVFLMANVMTSRPTTADLAGPRSAEQLVNLQAVEPDNNRITSYRPGYALIFMLPSFPSVAMSDVNETPPGTIGLREWTLDSEEKRELAEYLETTNDLRVVLRKSNGKTLTVELEQLSTSDRSYLRKLTTYTVITKLMAIIAHLAVVVGIVMIGYHHFDNFKMGVGAATLYLMLPYTAQMTGRVEHVIPAALLVWAIYLYRRPLAAGMFIGLAAGVVYYPLFLLPLWISFYWRRGLLRFGIGVLSMLSVLALALVFVSSDMESFWQAIKAMFGIRLPVSEGLQGIWGLGWDPVFRLPLIVGFVVLSFAFAVWPAQKNLGTLLSCSAALMIATQFWHGYGGGLFMAWYLPLALMAIFRPNLEDRVALTVLGEGWLSRRRRQQFEKKRDIAA